MSTNNNDEEFNIKNIIDFDPAKIKNKLCNYSSQKLSDIIVCDRYLGLNKDLAIFCMEELALRRSNGDNFDYESYIDEEFNKLPPIVLNAGGISDILNGLASFNKFSVK